MERGKECNLIFQVTRMFLNIRGLKDNSNKNQVEMV
jgi:hypothetical protein